MASCVSNTFDVSCSAAFSCLHPWQATVICRRKACSSSNFKVGDRGPSATETWLDLVGVVTTPLCSLPSPHHTKRTCVYFGRTTYARRPFLVPEYVSSLRSL